MTAQHSKCNEKNTDVNPGMQNCSVYTKSNSDEANFACIGSMTNPRSMSDSLGPHGPQHTRRLCPSLYPRVCSNSCPLSQWCYLTISSSAIPFFCLQSFLASVSFPMSWLFTSGGQSIGTSASASVLPVAVQGWFPFGLTGLTSLQSRNWGDPSSERRTLVVSWAHWAGHHLRTFPGWSSFVVYFPPDTFRTNSFTSFRFLPTVTFSTGPS